MMDGGCREKERTSMMDGCREKEMERTSRCMMDCCREKEMERTGNKTSTETGSTEELNRLTTPSTSPQATPTASVLSNTTPTLCVVSQATPTTDIAPHGTGSSGDTSMEAEEGVYQSNKVVAADSSEDQHVHSSEQTTSERPIRQSQLVLDDIPPQLLKVHHENMVKKVCGVWVSSSYIYLVYYTNTSFHETW